MENNKTRKFIAGCWILSLVLIMFNAEGYRKVDIVVEIDLPILATHRVSEVAHKRLIALLNKNSDVLKRSDLNNCAEWIAPYSHRHYTWTFVVECEGILEKENVRRLHDFVSEVTFDIVSGYKIETAEACKSALAELEAWLLPNTPDRWRQKSLIQPDMCSDARHFEGPPSSKSDLKVTVQSYPSLMIHRSLFGWLLLLVVSAFLLMGLEFIFDYGRKVRSRW